MNFLAHLVLAPQTPHGLLGSIAPDLIRGPLPGDLHPEIVQAAREHQHIDRYTDAHRAFQRTRDRLRSVVNPRLAGVLADVLYDHVLASCWADWRPGEHAAFVAQAEQQLMDHAHLVPEGMQFILSKMVDEHWLLSYATAQGLCSRLAQMSARLSGRFERTIDLTVTPDQLHELQEQLVDDFAALWPDLCTFVDNHRDAADPRLAS